MANYDPDTGNRQWAQNQLDHGLYYKWEETILETVNKIPSTVATSCSDTWNNDVPQTIEYLKSDEAKNAYKQTAGTVVVVNAGVAIEGAGAALGATRVSKTVNVAENTTIALWKRTINYLTLNIYDHPFWHPADLFEIVDNTLPLEWYFRFFGYSENFFLNAIWGYKDLLDPVYYNNLLELDETAIRIF
jgi:hypothetical protein